MKAAPLRQASLLLAVTVVGILAVAGAAGSDAATSSEAKITSVAFSGSQARPTITIHGQQLGTRPRPNPAYHPLGHPPLCPPTPTKPLAAYGFDYGTKLFLADEKQPPWSAGRYRPQVNELDCIGVVVVKFTPGLVVFRLGAFYGEGGFKLAAGDSYRVTVNGSTFRGRVRYR
jgi:hypothetical protein